MKIALIAWTLYLLNPNGSLGASLAEFKDKDSCVIASYAHSFFRGVETRCGQHGI